MFPITKYLYKESSFYQAAYSIDLDKMEAEVEDFLNKNSPDDDISVDCLNKAFSKMKGKDDKPGLDLLPEKKRMSYGEDLRKKLSLTISGNKEVQSREKFTKREVKALMTRHLLSLAIDLRKSEFDILVTLKVDQLCIFLTNDVHQTNLGLRYRPSDGGQNLPSGN